MELLDKLGIDWKLLLAQLVNFLIVLFVLQRLIYKPLINFLEKRRARIEQSLEEAERIERELQALEKTKVDAAVEVRRQAQEILKQAETQVEIQRQETLARVKLEAEKVIGEARDKIVAEQTAAMSALRKEAARLVVQAVTKVIGKMPGAELDKKWAEEAVQEVAKRKQV